MDADQLQIDIELNVLERITYEPSVLSFILSRPTYSATDPQNYHWYTYVHLPSRRELEAARVIYIL